MGLRTMYNTACRFEEYLSCRGLKLESFNSLLSLALTTRGCAPAILCDRPSLGKTGEALIWEGTYEST